MGNKLFIGNLAFSVDSTALSELFSQAGTVQTANVIMDRASGRSKGFGFVEMSDDTQAQSAIEQFNGKDLGGRAMSVSIAKPQEPRTERTGFGAGSSYRTRPSY